MLPSLVHEITLILAALDRLQERSGHDLPNKFSFGEVLLSLFVFFFQTLEEEEPFKST